MAASCAVTCTWSPFDLSLSGRSGLQPLQRHLQALYRKLIYTKGYLQGPGVLLLAQHQRACSGDCHSTQRRRDHDGQCADGQNVPPPLLLPATATPVRASHINGGTISCGPSTPDTSLESGWGLGWRACSQPAGYPTRGVPTSCREAAPHDFGAEGVKAEGKWALAEEEGRLFQCGEVNKGLGGVRVRVTVKARTGGRGRRRARAPTQQGPGRPAQWPWGSTPAPRTVSLWL
jgi:hypothetical protein